MINYPEEKEIHDRQYWLDKIQGKVVAPEKYQKKRQKMSDKKMRDEDIKGAFLYAPNEIKTDRELVLLALEKGKEFMSHVDESLLNKDFILEYAEKCRWPSILSIPNEFRLDDDIFLAFFAKQHENFRYYSWDSKKYSNRDGIKKLIEINSHVIKDLSNTYKDDLELAKLAIDKDPKNIEHLNKRTTEKICVDKEYCKELLSKNPNAFPYISPKLRMDREFITPYVQKNPSFLENIPKSVRCNLRADKEFMAPFAKSSYMFLYAAAENLLEDEELMLISLRNYPSALYKAGKSLQNKDFYMKAIAVNPKIYSNLPPKFKLDDDLIYQLLTYETFYNDKYEKENTINLIHPDKMLECQEEYGKLPFQTQECITFESYLRKKFINIYLTNNLPPEEEEYKPKKLKI
jgi:hypothetical protein